MSKSFRKNLILIGAVLSGAILLLLGVYLGRVALRGPGFWSVPSMHRYSSDQASAGFWSEHPMLGITDQATLHELLRKLYNLGYLLRCVACLDLQAEVQQGQREDG